MLAEGRQAGGETGQHWYQEQKRSFKAAAADQSIQEQLVDELEKIGNVSVPT